MPNFRKSHEECRQAVCLLCLGKTKEMRKINPDQIKIIQEYFITGFDEADIRLPCALCTTCRVTVLAYSKGDFRRRLVTGMGFFRDFRGFRVFDIF